MNPEQTIFAVAGPICLLAAAGAVTRRDPLSGALSLTVALVSRALSVISDAVTAAAAALMVGRRRLRAVRETVTAKE